MLSCDEQDVDNVAKAAKGVTAQLETWINSEGEGSSVVAVVLPRGVTMTIQQVGDEISDLKEVIVTYERTSKSPW